MFYNSTLNLSAKDQDFSPSLEFVTGGSLLDLVATSLIFRYLWNSQT